MKTDFLVDFFKEITSESLHRGAIEFLHSFPLSEQSVKAIEALGDKATSPSIDLEDYSRVFPKNGNGELVEMDADFFISNYYTTKVYQFTKELLEDFEVFLSDTDLCGSDNGKVEALKNVLNSLNRAAYKVLDIRIRFAEIKEAILDTIFKLIDRVIQELSQLDVQEYPKYDIDKLKEFIREPFSDMREEETGFVHLISNRKEENYYLLNVPVENNPDDESFNFESTQSDYENQSIVQNGLAAIEKIVDKLIAEGLLHNTSKHSLVNYLDNGIENDADEKHIQWLGTVTSFTQFISALIWTNQLLQEGSIPWTKWHRVIKFRKRGGVKADSFKKLYQKTINEKSSKNPFIDMITQTLAAL